MKNGPILVIDGDLGSAPIVANPFNVPELLGVLRQLGSAERGAV